MELQPIGKSHALPIVDRLSRLPWWALVAGLLGALIAWSMLTSDEYQVIFRAISQGIVMTIYVTLIAYVAAILLGLVCALGRVSKNVVIYQIATFYVEIIRGVPTLVLLLYIAFVIIPEAIVGINRLGAALLPSVFIPLETWADPLNVPLAQWTAGLAAPGTLAGMLAFGVGSPLVTLQLRDVDNTFRVIVALTVAYSAFVAEIFRAGIESIDRGQTEAARALGMTQWQALRCVILPQAIRNVLPPLGNDFIAMLKDSSLVSALGVNDITQLGRLYAASTYLTFQTYNVVAFLYLTMTLILSILVKMLERRLARSRRSG